MHPYFFNHPNTSNRRMSRQIITWQWNKAHKTIMISVKYYCVHVEEHEFFTSWWTMNVKVTITLQQTAILITTYNLRSRMRADTWPTSRKIVFLWRKGRSIIIFIHYHNHHHHNSFLPKGYTDINIAWKYVPASSDWSNVVLEGRGPAVEFPFRMDRTRAFWIPSTLLKLYT